MDIVNMYLQNVHWEIIYYYYKIYTYIYRYKINIWNNNIFLFFVNLQLNIYNILILDF